MLKGKTIVLGVTGSIALYKGADLASKLVQEGATVRVAMTKEALQFMSPVTFRSLTSQAVATDMFEFSSEFSIEHVALADAADIVVIAPATANIIAKIVDGLADDILTCTVLATRAPIIVAPAMHTGMWENVATQENVETLKDRGVIFAGPGYGRLASGGVGAGRFIEVETIIGAIKQVLGRKGDLAGKKIVVTAGGTQEAIDPVRYIGNRSSGKMGYALAEVARDRGADVTLIAGPTALLDPAGMDVVKIESAVQMKKAVDKAVIKADVLIMAAAVADYMPENAAKQKIKKDASGAGLSLKLVRTPDILAEVKGDFIKVGFAAETQDVIDNARVKLEKKQLDIIVANDVSAKDSGFNVDTNRCILISKSKTEKLLLMSKREVADKVLDGVVGLVGRKKA